MTKIINNDEMWVAKLEMGADESIKYHIAGFCRG